MEMLKIETYSVLLFLAAHTVIPFLLLGIGIDNIFVITQVIFKFCLGTLKH